MAHSHTLERDIFGDGSERGWHVPCLCPPHPANKLRLAMQFDAILKRKKGSWINKRKKDAGDLDQFADEEVSSP